MGGQGLLLLIGLKILIIMDSLQNIVIFQVLKVSGCWWNQNFLIEMTKSQNIAHLL